MNETLSKLKPMVRICAWCTSINREGYEIYDMGVDKKVKDEIAIVDHQIKIHRHDFAFTHGTCIPHLKIAYRTMPDLLDNALRQAQSQEGGSIPCLLQDEALRHAYMRGLFTPELVQQYLQSQQQSKKELTEHLKKLAGIPS